MQTTACLRKGDGYMDKSKTHILAFFTSHDAPEKKSVYVEMNGQGDELTRLVASVAIKMFSLGTTNKNIIQMRKQYLFGIINKWLDEDSVQDIELKEYSYEATAATAEKRNDPSASQPGNMDSMMEKIVADAMKQAKENPGQAQGVMFKVPAGDMPMEEVVKHIISAVDKQARKDQNGG